MVGVLPKDDDLDLVKGGDVEGAKDVFGRRKDGFLGVFLFDKFGKFLEVGLGELGLEDLLPRWINTNVHRRG